MLVLELGLGLESGLETLRVETPRYEKVRYEMSRSPSWQSKLRDGGRTDKLQEPRRSDDVRLQSLRNRPADSTCRTSSCRRSRRALVLPASVLFSEPAAV